MGNLSLLSPFYNLLSGSEAEEGQMEILIFLLLAGLWAAFLLPPFLSSRREAPISSTQHFDRSLARLASVQGHSRNGGELTRARVLARRRRVLVALLSAAVLTLALALWRRSLNLLFVHLLVDSLAVGYVAMLLSIKQSRKRLQAPRVELEGLQAGSDEGTEEDRQVRLLASG